MASINKARKNKIMHTNAITAQGGKGVSFKALAELKRLALNCYLFENQFYQSGSDIAKQISAAIADPSVTVSDVMTVALAAKAAHLRHTPLWILTALFANRKTKDESHAITWQDVRGFLTRPDQATELLAMWWSVTGKDTPVPAAYKKAFRDYMISLKRYQLAKYKQTGKAVQLRDIVRISHPTPKNDTQAKDFSDLIKDTLPNEDTWEARLSVPGADKKAVWNGLLAEGILGDLALIRNVRNMVAANVDPIKIADTLAAVKSQYITAGQIVQAYKSVKDFEAEFDEMFTRLFAQGGRLSAEIAIMVDVSGSMNDKLSRRGDTTRQEVAAGLAAQLAARFRRSSVYLFDTGLAHASGRSMSLVKEIIANTGGGTDCYGAWAAVKQRHENAHLVMITDEQDGGFYRGSMRQGGFQAKKHSFLINVASNTVGLAIPEQGVERINGWSDKIPDYILTRINAIENADLV